jgi:hypothetical protein
MSKSVRTPFGRLLILVSRSFLAASVAAPSLAAAQPGPEPVASACSSFAFLPYTNTPEMFGRPALGDFNGDGKPDIALLEGSPSSVVVMLGDGAGGFVQAGPSTSTGVTSVHVPRRADFNKDGKMDLAVLSSGGDVVTLLGNGAGGFSPAVPSAGNVGSNADAGSQIIVADVDIDGTPDLVALSSAGVRILRGDGSGTFSIGAPLSMGQGGGLSVADFNLDGKPDIARKVYAPGGAAPSTSPVTVYFGDGLGGFAPHPSTTPALFRSTPHLFGADFDLDGKPDFAQWYEYADRLDFRYGLYLYFGDGAGAFLQSSRGFNALGWAMAVSDFNGDGLPDIASASPKSNKVLDPPASNLVVHFGLGGREFSFYKGSELQLFPMDTGGASSESEQSLMASDLDLNGFPDLVIAGRITSDPSPQARVVVRVQMNACSPTTLPRLTVNDVTARAAETTKMFFQVNLSRASDSPVTVNYATADGTATAGTDYTAATGSLTFAPGTTQSVVEITIQRQSATLARAFTLSLTAPTNATLAKASGSGNIVNTVQGTPALYVDDPSVLEGNAADITLLGFNVRLSEPSSTSITVDFATADGTATAGTDYLAKSGTLTFAPGKTVKAALVPIKGNTLLQAKRTLLVNLTNSGGIGIAKAQGTGTIIDDDPVMAAQTIDQYRLYSPVTGEHLYTTDSNEYSVLGTIGWHQEGKAYRMFKDTGWFGGSYTRPMYRLYHPGILQHHWTMDANEASTLASFDWDYEGIAGYMLSTQESGTVPLYRLMFPQPLLHLWTTDANEKNILSTQRGWAYEGILGYVIP